MGAKKHQADINRFFEACSEATPWILLEPCSPIHRVVIDYYVNRVARNNVDSTRSTCDRHSVREADMKINESREIIDEAWVKKKTL